jgi:23S rRNA (uracil1939-C5)-methyltransferase
VTGGKKVCSPYKKKKSYEQRILQSAIKITSLGSHGDGIGELSGKKIFIPFSLVGETVLITKKGDRARVDEIIKPSINRVSPICSHFTHCGGCVAQHIDPDTYRSWKKNIIKTALLNQGLDVNVDALIDAHGKGRRRVTLNVQFDKNNTQVGFMGKGSHNLLDFNECPILVDDLSEAKKISRLLSAPFKSSIKKLKINITSFECGLDCNIQIPNKHNKLDLNIRMDIASLALKLDLARVSVCDEIIAEHRSPMIKYENAHVYPPPSGFLQATFKGELIIGDLVIDNARSANKIIDLFCGIGSFTLRLARTSSVLAADVNELQIKSLSNALRYCQGLKPIITVVRDLYTDPYKANELSKFDCAIFNPPRAGAKAQAIEISKSGISIVIAVSCDSASFARDTAILINGGYCLKKVIPIDQFKFTRHIEIVAVFKRK